MRCSIMTLPFTTASRAHRNVWGLLRRRRRSRGASPPASVATATTARASVFASNHGEAGGRVGGETGEPGGAKPSGTWTVLAGNALLPSPVAGRGRGHGAVALTSFVVLVQAGVLGRALADPLHRPRVLAPG